MQEIAIESLSVVSAEADNGLVITVCLAKAALDLSEGAREYGSNGTEVVLLHERL